MFRFSLGTLVLLSLWCGAAMWVWRTREPWVFAGVERKADPGRERMLCRVIGSPDRRRLFVFEYSKPHEEGRPMIQIFDRPNTRQLIMQFPIEFDAKILDLEDEDTLKVWTNNDRVATYHRRFPEWWWGHFYRPELWVLVVLSMALVAIFVKQLWAHRAIAP